MPATHHGDRFLGRSQMGHSVHVGQAGSVFTSSFRTHIGEPHRDTPGREGGRGGRVLTGRNPGAHLAFKKALSSAGACLR